MKKYILIIITSLLGLTHAMADDISIPNLTIEPGTTTTVGISLNNTETNLVSFQMDLTLPEGISINKAGCSLSNRFTDENQELTIGKQATNVYRLTSTSFSLTPILGTSGEIITLSLTATDDFEGGTATLGNIRFVTSQSEKIIIADTSFNINVGIASPNITFADANVKAICVANWDANEDGELSEEEAAAVTDLGTAFENNTTITSFNELQYFTGLTKIAMSAFDNCTKLISIIIPHSVTQVANFAFDNCSSLTSIYIPQSVVGIGDRSFRGCSGLTSITVESGNWQYDSRDNCNAIIETESDELGVGCKSTVIPNSITRIGNYAFCGQTGLTSITIPNSVTLIGNYAFSGCSGLISVTVNAETPITITSDVFSNRTNATLYVPAGCKEVYEAADYWKEFKEIIENIEFIPGDVNSDNAVDVTDYMTIANYILGQAPTTFNEAAADVTQDDNVDVADYLGVANIILYGNYQGPQANNANAIKALTTEQASPWMGMEVTEDGLVELLLHDTPTFSAFQIDIFLPEGIEIYGANMSKANQTRNLSYAQLQSGAWRLLYGTMDGKTVNLADHSLLTLKLTSKNKEAFGDIDVEGITLVRPNTSVMHLSGVHGTLPTGISDIESMMPAEANCYDLTGRKVTESHLKKGIYIINGKKVSIK